MTRLNGLLAVVRIAHEVIYDLHAELVASGRSGERAGELLAESVDITLQQVPELTRNARRLTRTWREQSVLDPDTAASTLHDLELELEGIESRVTPALDRQREIARELQSLRDESA